MPKTRNIPSLALPNLGREPLDWRSWRIECRRSIERGFRRRVRRLGLGACSIVTGVGLLSSIHNRWAEFAKVNNSMFWSGCQGVFRYGIMLTARKDERIAIFIFLRPATC